MKEAYCDTCQAQRGFKRAFGWGTFFAMLCTLGWWLLVLPFYPLRCIVCGRELIKRTAGNITAGPSIDPAQPWKRPFFRA